MEERHVDQVVKVHMESFEGFFLSFLGERFLRLFYLGICRDPRAIRLVAISAAGEVIGCAVGAMNPAGFYKGLLKRDWFRFCMASGWAVLKRPSVIPRLARAFLHPSSSPAGEDVAMFMSMGVSINKAAQAYSRYVRDCREAGVKDMSQARYGGAGRELAEAFLAEALRRGARRIVLDADRDNKNVNRLHESMGYKKTREYVTREGRPMYEYEYVAEDHADAVIQTGG